MRKILVMLFLCFLVFGYSVMPLAMASEHDDSGSGSTSDNSGSGSDSDDSSDTDSTSDNSGSSGDSDDDSSDAEISDSDDDEDDDSGRGRNRGRERGGDSEDRFESVRELARERLRDEYRREFRDSEGRRVEVERKVEFKDGEFKIEIKRKVIINGEEVEQKIKIERDENGVTRRVEIEGSNVSIGENIEIDDDFEENNTDLEAVTSDGERHRIRILPDEVRSRIRERVRNANITDFSLEEIEDRNVPRVVYRVNSEHPGRFLGVFKLAMRAETQIDPETGEVLDVNVPWWAFLVAQTEVPDEDEVIGNETDVNETSGEDDLTATFPEGTSTNDSEIAA